jgi:von Willebrand factor type A domain
VLAIWRRHCASRRGMGHPRLSSRRTAPINSTCRHRQRRSVSALVGGRPDQLALSDVSVRQPIDGSQKLAGIASVANFGSDARSTTVQIIADVVLVDSQAITVDPRPVRTSRSPSPRRRATCGSPPRRQPRRKDARLAPLLVIDIPRAWIGSSMAFRGIDMARQAAILATRAVRDDDQVGVLVFDHRFSWLAPTARVSVIGRADLREQDRQFDTVGWRGDFAALDEGSTAIRGITADLPNLVLFTDGNSRDANYNALTSQLRQARIGLSTVGLGPEADTTLLATLAKDGQGRFYYNHRPAELPRILAREVAIAKRSAVVEGSIQPRLVSPSPILRGIVPDEVPLLGATSRPLRGRTRRSCWALRTTGRLLAQSRTGLGRAVAWTSDVGGAWTPAWVDWSTGALALACGSNSWLGRRGADPARLSGRRLADRFGGGHHARRLARRSVRRAGFTAGDGNSARWE